MNVYLHQLNFKQNIEKTYATKIKYMVNIINETK